MSEGAYYGHLVLRLMGCLMLCYTSWVIGTGRLRKRLLASPGALFRGVHSRPHGDKIVFVFPIPDIEQPYPAEM